MIEPRMVWNYLKKYLYGSRLMYTIGFALLGACIVESLYVPASLLVYITCAAAVICILSAYAHDVISGKYLRQSEMRTGSKLSVPLQARERMDILIDCMLAYIDQGYEVTSQVDDFTLFMKRERRFSCIWASILTISGIGLLLYILYYWSKRDNFIAITVDEYGNVTVTKSNEGMIA